MGGTWWLNLEWVFILGGAWSPEPNLKGTGLHSALLRAGAGAAADDNTAVRFQSIDVNLKSASAPRTPLFLV